MYHKSLSGHIHYLRQITELLDKVNFVFCIVES